MNTPSAQPPERATVPHRRILGVPVHATSYEDATDRILAWASTGESRYVCVSNVHVVMEANDDETFRTILADADLVTPDGMPLVWGLRLLGVRGATRVYGPDLVPAVCAAAAERQVPVGFYGGTDASLSTLVTKLQQMFPALRVAYRWSPPFRALTREEEAEVVREIDGSGARILFVGLGCPKQERWMARHRGRIGAVMLGVGAAFDFLAGAKRQAPPWMRRAGLEWSFRLLSEPRRLWRRYLYHNPRFIALFGAQVLRDRVLGVGATGAGGEGAR